MRKTLTSLAVVGAAGAMLAAGGAYSVFNDAGTSTGGLSAGTVKLSVTGQHPATDIFALTGLCTHTYTDNASPTDALNMGTVNNTGCVSNFTVHNAGSLPFELSGTTVKDTNPDGLTCVTSTITNGTKITQVLNPGADQVVTIGTATVNDVKGCQNLTDKVTVNLVGTESKPGSQVTCYASTDSRYADLGWDGVYTTGKASYYDGAFYGKGAVGSCSGTAYYHPIVLQAATSAAAALHCVGPIEPRYWPTLPANAWLCDGTAK